MIKNFDSERILHTAKEKGFEHATLYGEWLERIHIAWEGRLTKVQDNSASLIQLKCRKGKTEFEWVYPQASTELFIEALQHTNLSEWKPRSRLHSERSSLTPNSPSLTKPLTQAVQQLGCQLWQKEARFLQPRLQCKVQQKNFWLHHMGAEPMVGEDNWTSLRATWEIAHKKQKNNLLPTATGSIHTHSFENKVIFF